MGTGLRYGAVMGIEVTATGKRRPSYAHRVAWELAFGAIPPSLEVCHRCDVPLCCNPSHLFLGTSGDNIRDMVSKGRNAKVKHCKLTDAQVRRIRAECRPGRHGTMVPLAREFGVSKSCISNVLSGRTKQHVV